MISPEIALHPTPDSGYQENETQGHPQARSLSPALRRELTQRYLHNDFSHGVAAEAYGLPSKDVVKEFVRWHKRERAAELAGDPGRLAARDAGAPVPDDPATLKRLLQDAHDEATVWRTLVRVAEEQIGLPILNKPIAKPPVR